MTPGAADGIVATARRTAGVLAQGAALAALGAYRSVLRPLLPGACRFEPSCSHYAEQAIRLHGAWRGAWLALRRIARCRPGGGGGEDPVPRVGTGR